MGVQRRDVIRKQLNYLLNSYFKCQLLKRFLRYIYHFIFLTFRLISSNILALISSFAHGQIDDV